jgi:hypothetical protein
MKIQLAFAGTFCAALLAIATLAVLPQISRADESGNLVLGSRSVWQPCGGSADPGLVAGRRLLSYERGCLRRCCSSTRDLGRQVLSYRQCQFGFKSECAPRSLVPGSDAYLRNIG